MKIVQPSIEVFFHYPRGFKTLQTFLEIVGRTCYKSEDKIGEGTASKFVAMLERRGHKAMLEHCVASVKFVCDRGVSHELVRHRIGISFAQESTRFCDYSKGKFGGEITVIEPPGLTAETRAYWKAAVNSSEGAYLSMLEQGVPAQIARSVLPTCLKTEIWATANLREWQLIFSLRCAPAAHPQMRELMDQVYDVFAKEVPEMYPPRTNNNAVKEAS